MTYYFPLLLSAWPKLSTSNSRQSLLEFPMKFKYKFSGIFSFVSSPSTILCSVFYTLQPTSSSFLEVSICPRHCWPTLEQGCHLLFWPLIPNNSNWFPDSSASFHVTGENQNIHQNAPNESLEKIYIGNGQGLPIQSSGSSYFSAPNNPNISLSLPLL